MENEDHRDLCCHPHLFFSPLTDPSNSQRRDRGSTPDTYIFLKGEASFGYGPAIVELDQELFHCYVGLLELNLQGRGPLQLFADYGHSQ